MEKKFSSQIGSYFLTKALIGVGLCCLFGASMMAETSHKKAVNNSPLNSKEIMRQSQISYEADGGFTAVRSYSVLISCVDGKISTLSTIRDPQAGNKDGAPLYRSGTMSQEAYFNLWNQLNRMAVFAKKSAPALRYDALDEFTLTFHAEVGEKQNEFSVAGCSRPEAAQYYAFRKVLDDVVDMPSLWNSHQVLAQK